MREFILLFFFSNVINSDDLFLVRDESVTIETMISMNKFR